MRNKLIAFFLSLVFTAKAFSAPAGSACNWVDQEALAALGLVNSVPKKEAPLGVGTSGHDQCTIAAPDTPVPAVIVSVSVQPAGDGFVFKPVCNWMAPQLTNVEIGICYMNDGHTSASLTLIVPSPSDSEIQSTLSTQIERLFNKHLEAAPK